jgi:hypothetical protein
MATIGTAASICAIALRLPLQLSAIDDVALRVLLPASLAFVLAFAPAPSTRTGAIARDLTVLALSAAVFGGDGQPVMLACYPLLLMTSVLLGWLWPHTGARRE